MNKENNEGYQHREAFCHMQYMGQDSPSGNINELLNGITPMRKKIFVVIWNSRDGVTPFITYSKEFGLELKHVNWQHDKRDPGYKPKKGDLIWRDWREDEIIKFATERWQAAADEYEKVKDLKTVEELSKVGYDWNPLPTLEQIVNNKEKYIADYVKERLERHEPHLELVTEDWK